MHHRRLPLAYSCPQSLEGMPRRSETERWCSVCDKRVHELSAMRESEARALLRRSANRPICVEYRVDAGGRVLFRDQAPRTMALAGLALAVTLAATGCVGFEHEEVSSPDELAREYWVDSIVPAAAPEPADPGACDRPEPEPVSTPLDDDDEPAPILMPGGEGSHLARGRVVYRPVWYRGSLRQLEMLINEG